MGDIEEILRLAAKRNASDIHNQVGLPPMLRILTRPAPLDSEKLSAEAIERLIFLIMSEQQKKLFHDRLEFDFSYRLPGVGRFRINVFKQRDSVAAAFRHFPHEIPSPETLGKALYDRAVITEEDALEHAFDAREMARLLGRRRL